MEKIFVLFWSSKKTYTRKVKEITKQNKKSGKTEKAEIFVAAFPISIEGLAVSSATKWQHAQEPAPVALTKFGNKMRQRRYPCEFCDLVVKSPSDLQRHLMKHTGDKPFECTHCLLLFTRKHSLKVHQKRCKVLLGQAKVGADSKDEKKRGAKRRRKVKKEQTTAESDGVETLIGGKDHIEALLAVEELKVDTVECLEPKKELIESKTEDNSETQTDFIETTTKAL